MVKRKTKSTEYYAVSNGRLDEPTIFSSWGDVHPRVTGYRSPLYRGFHTIEEARKFMDEKGVKQPKEIIKDRAGNTTPIWNSNAFYAVANGKSLGIYMYWHGDNGVDPKVNEASGACHKKFRTRVQAQAFIEDWKESFADVYRALIKEALDQGLRPLDMNLSVTDILKKTDAKNTGDLEELKLNDLSIKDEK